MKRIISAVVALSTAGVLLTACNTGHSHCTSAGAGSVKLAAAERPIPRPRTRVVVKRRTVVHHTHHVVVHHHTVVHHHHYSTYC